MVQCPWIRVNETGFILLKPDSTMGIGLYVWYFHTYPARVPSPRVSLCLLLSTWLRRAYMARSLAHEAQIRDQQHSSKAWRRGNWHSKPPDFSFREKAALEQSDPPALACVLFDLLLRSLTFALSSAGTQGLPARGLLERRASRR